MKRLIVEQRFAFGEENLTDVWMLGHPIRLSQILIHIDFDQPLQDRFDLMLTLMIPNPPIVPYNMIAGNHHIDMLIGRKDTLVQDKCGIIQVEGNSSSSSVSGKVSIYEISEEDRGLY